MDARQIINYVNFAALICYILGRILNMGILSWIGLGIMTLSSIWTIIHWKENGQDVELYLCGSPSTRRTITFSDSNSAAMSTGDSSKNTYYKWGFLFYLCLYYRYYQSLLRSGRYRVSDSFASYSYLGSGQNGTEQQIIKLRMDSTIGNNHLSLGITFILYRTKQYN